MDPNLAKEPRDEGVSGASIIDNVSAIPGHALAVDKPTGEQSRNTQAHNPNVRRSISAVAQSLQLVHNDPGKV